jgi:hypothetical protein
MPYSSCVISFCWTRGSNAIWKDREGWGMIHVKKKRSVDLGAILSIVPHIENTN